jgi:hypothetical protein
VKADELESLREDALSERAREEFRQSDRAVRSWERAAEDGIEAALDWVDQLRALFGDPPVRMEPWRERAFRL